MKKSLIGLTAIAMGLMSINVANAATATGTL
ncbi:SCPU domain-containing protein, partial [Acinetobacter baumannii]